MNETLTDPLDPDTDGQAGPMDCDEGDATLWSACATCVDADGDEYGTDCDYAPDCDDTSSSIYPGASGDTAGNSIDGDCSGIDGPGIFDDFEDGRFSGVWESHDELLRHSTDYANSGSCSLFAWDSFDAETVPQDMSLCTAVDWSLEARAPLGRFADTFSGTITDILALESDFQLRLDGRTDNYVVYIDDIEFTCVP